MDTDSMVLLFVPCSPAFLVIMLPTEKTGYCADTAATAIQDELESAPVKWPEYCKSNVAEHQIAWWHVLHMPGWKTMAILYPVSITSLSFAVHSLKPADVKVIAALGDSLTVRRQCF